MSFHESLQKGFLIDNNIWSAHEKGYPVVVDILDEFVMDEMPLMITRMIQMELLSFFEIDINPEIKKNRYTYIYDIADEIIVEDEKVFLLAAEIRRTAKLNGRRVPKGPDAMIAATAIVHGLTLVSNNDKDFTWIQAFFDFEYFNPIYDTSDYTKFSEDYAKLKDK